MDSHVPVSPSAMTGVRMTSHSRRFREFLTQVKEDWAVNGSDWTRPGFRALAVHRFGGWVQVVRIRGLRGVLWQVYLILHRYIRNHYGIELYYTTKVGRRFAIGHQGGIVIHPHAIIGDDCIIRQNVTIGATNFDHRREAPTLGNRVEVGCGVTIIGKIAIGDGARIAPNVVVMTSIPAGSTVVMPPPQIISFRKNTVRSQ